MTSAEPRVFDFHEIASLDNTGVALRNWIAKSSSFFSQFWDRATGFAAQISVGKVSTESYDSALNATNKDSNYCVVEIQDSLSSIWYAGSDEIRIVIKEMLCIPEEDSEEESQETTGSDGGELTEIELSLAQLFLSELATTLKNGWLGNNPINLSVSSLDRDPKKTRLLRGRDLVTKVEIDIQLQSRRTTLQWLLPKQAISELMEDCVDRRSQPPRSGEPSKPSEEMVSQVPLEVVVVIGETSIPMVDLSRLKTGQLLKLNQRIDQPVVAYVNEQPYYECWPGRIGSNQSVEISKCLRAELVGGGK